MNSEVTASFTLYLNCIKNIQDFDGSDKNQLPDFINQINELMPCFQVFDEQSRKVLFNYIKNKCCGLVRPVLHRYGNVTSWERLKEILIKHFGEKESSDELMDALKLCRIESTIEQYYDKINEIANRLHNRILTHSDGTYTTQEVNRISLRVFRDNLPEPTKTMIFARNPPSLDDAYKIIEDARHQSYTLYGPIRKQFSNKPPFRKYFSNDSNNQNERTPNGYHNQPQIEENPGSFNRQNTNRYENRTSYNNNYAANPSRNSRMSYNTIQPQQVASRNTQNNNSVGQMDIGNINTNFQLGDQQDYPI
ncbi:hybrid signal transduction histidine kinase M-like [Drosophila ficusphila]|uniref:hybrid signal transduction histidine kinase M-like n=1 Tax=Drosophila ficusphila TaxID=30025 RepID=UPI001C8A7397|nr:hybrid signal transduction histidine kinase M-like [Drosophila ficusphila]XP_043064536.1 hybrid signal transduction histidine kinase M-like [Drosophila ficusphila]